MRGRWNWPQSGAAGCTSRDVDRRVICWLVRSRRASVGDRADGQGDVLVYRVCGCALFTLRRLVLLREVG
jgi:hypothetical protein